MTASACSERAEIAGRGRCRLLRRDLLHDLFIPGCSGMKVEKHSPSEERGDQRLEWPMVRQASSTVCPSPSTTSSLLEDKKELLTQTV
jgi:hypothetical protein